MDGRQIVAEAAVHTRESHSTILLASTPELLLHMWTLSPLLVWALLSNHTRICLGCSLHGTPVGLHLESWFSKISLSLNTLPSG